jgi:hypothetical protein
MNVTYCEFDWILGCRHGWPSLYCLSIRCVPRLWHLEAIGQWTIPASVILSLEQGEDASLLPPYTTWHSLEHSWVTESLMFLWVFQLHWLILAYTGFNSSMWIFWGRRREHTQLTRTCFPAAISRPWCLASGLWHTLRVIRMHCSHKHKNCIPRLYWNRSDHLAEHQRSGIQFKNIGFSQAAEWARVTWPKQDAVPWCTVPGIQFNMYSLKAMSVGAKTSCIRILGHARPCPPRWDRAEAISIQSFMSTKLFTSHGRPE